MPRCFGADEQCFSGGGCFVPVVRSTGVKQHLEGLPGGKSVEKVHKRCACTFGHSHEEKNSRVNGFA